MNGFISASYDQGELNARLDAATATVKAKLAAGIQIKNQGFAGTPAQRLDWIVLKSIQIDQRTEAKGTLKEFYGNGYTWQIRNIRVALCRQYKSLSLDQPEQGKPVSATP